MAATEPPGLCSNSPEYENFCRDLTNADIYTILRLSEKKYFKGSLVLALFNLLSAFFVIWRGVLTIPVRRIVLKIALSMVVILAAFKFQILHFFGGPLYFAPELPRWLLLSGAVVYSIHFIFFLLLLTAEFVRLFINLALAVSRRKVPEKYRKFALWINPALLLLALTTAAIGIVSGTAVPGVRKVNLVIDGLPIAADGMKIAFLTDLHIDRMSDPQRLTEIVAQVNRCEPDVILLGGDLIDGKVERMGDLLLPLKDLRAEYGVFGVPGNHEYYSGFEAWMKFFTEKCNVRMLINSAVKLPCGLTLAGVGDPVGKRFKLPTVNFRRAFENVGANEAVILLAHRPGVAREAEKMEIMLQLSGHTHGGMLPGLAAIVKRMNGGFVSGKYRIGKTLLYVSNGSGIWSGFPVRLGVPPEITLINLKRKK